MSPLRHFGAVTRCEWGKVRRNLILCEESMVLVARWAPPLRALTYPDGLTLGIAVIVGYNPRTPTTNLTTLIDHAGGT